MTLATSLKPLLHSIRSLPGTLGIRPHSVSVVISTWSGAYPGKGTKTESVTAITEANGQPPRIRDLNSEELAVGQLPGGTKEIGPITSTAAALVALKPTLTSGQTIHLRIIGPSTAASGDLYEISDLKMDRALHFMVQAKPVEKGT